MDAAATTTAPTSLGSGPAGLATRVVSGAVAVTRLPGQAVDAGRRLVADATDVVEQAAGLVTRVVALVGTIEVLVDEIAVIAGRASLVVSQADAVAIDAGRTATLADVQVRRLAALIDAIEPAVAQLRPTLERSAEVLEPQHAESVAKLLDLTPEVIDLITPALRNLGALTPELHSLAERFEAMGQIVEGIPGASMFKRRGAADDEDGESK
ncbi:hypothetical protein BKA08_001050 [Nocardioides marinisabuli]|uniref:Ribulose 1,5-bisphosphate carboxylase large subunit n=1 Tax=Nocardioides marinisabuli TaxID=419476 RepID=A0A7Y9JPA3_9ACTN|nr:hypothetical protein [Nocardioides marinisabuli]NYD56812.1 hypothetical protein [Nocardioides marinisabuli]